jgi:ABC-type multidrug transport system fused ATPase/permease subunit
MFNGTIEENVHFGDLHASIQDIKAACDLAGALEFIEALPLKFQTVIGERGYRLSGGERQRIALARALLRNPEMLILDEATSNLDSYSERKIQNSLNQIQKDKTLVLVAHRLSTVIQADQIFVLEDGKIVENGKHEKLILQKGLYSKLWKIQSEKVRV